MTCSVVSVSPACHWLKMVAASAASTATGRCVCPPRWRPAARAASAASAVAWPLTQPHSVGSLTRPKAAFLSGAGAPARFSRKYSSTASFSRPASGLGVFRTNLRTMAACQWVQVSVRRSVRAPVRAGARAARTDSCGP